MRFFVAVVLIIIVSFITCMFVPWWSVALVAFLVIAFIHLKPFRAFAAGFVGIFFLWSVMSFYISFKNEHILAHKISMIIIKADSPVLIIVVTGLVGGLVAGCAALTASYLRIGSR